jgi:hypothetical protein
VRTAVKAAAAHIDPTDMVIVLNGDHPFITAETLQGPEAYALTGEGATLRASPPEDLQRTPARGWRHARQDRAAAQGERESTETQQSAPPE